MVIYARNQWTSPLGGVEKPTPEIDLAMHWRSSAQSVQPLASKKIWHDGQIVAMVVADTFEAAREAA